MKGKNKIERILLIQPPVTSFVIGDVTPNMPLGLAYIAAVLEREGYRVKILDALIEGWQNVKKLDNGRFQIGLSFEDIETKIKNFDPHLIGISSMFTAQWHNAVRVAEAAKKIKNNVPVVVGGAHPTAMPEEVLDNKNINFVVIGEGEESLLKLIKCLESGNPLELIPGIGLRMNGKKIINYEREYITELDSLPFPARHLLPLEKYFTVGLSHGGKRKRHRFTSIITSRGCPAHCVFCSAYKLWGRTYRMRNPENVIEEIKTLRRDFGIEELSIEDDNFTFDKERANKICDLLKSECKDIVWDTPNGIAAYCLDEDLIKNMKESGCYRISFAVESGNQKFLSEVIKKPLKLECVPPLIDYARKIGLEINVFFIIGVPGETKETIKDTFRFARKIRVYDPFISLATPYPGTEMLDICLKNGYLEKDFNPASLTIHQYNITTSQLPKEELKKILKSELQKMYFYKIFDLVRRPVNLIRKLKAFWKNHLNTFLFI